MRIASRILTVFLAAFVATELIADDCESGLDGENIYPIESQNIRMTSERVDISVEDWGQPAGHTLFRVTAEFVLLNDSDESQTIMVAFPGTYVEGEFTRHVDGEEVEVQTYEAKDGTTHMGSSGIAFAPRQTRMVKVRYVGASDATSGWDYGKRWSYVLKTGAHWKGKIGSIEVTLRLPRDLPFAGIGPFDFKAVTLSPSGYKLRDRTAVWRMKNIEPEEDIVVEWEAFTPLAVSDPLRKAGRDEAPRLQLEYANMIADVFSNRKKVIAAYTGLRRAFPDSYEATLVDYHLGKCYAHYSNQGDWSLWKTVHDAKRALRHYEAAMKQALPDEMYVDLLCQLYALYSLEFANEKEAERILSLAGKAVIPEEPGTTRVVGFFVQAAPQRTMKVLECFQMEPEIRASTIEIIARDCGSGEGVTNAIALYDLLRTEFPEFYQDILADFKIASLYGGIWAREGKVERSGTDLAKAAVWYQKALEQSRQPTRHPYAANVRQASLVQLYLYWSLDGADREKAAQFLAQIKQERFPLSENGPNNWLGMIGLACSSQEALDVLDSMTVKPGEEAEANALRQQLQKKPGG